LADPVDPVGRVDRVDPATTRRGPGRVLVAVYGLFALAAGARSLVQLTTKYHDAPLAYLLSAFAAVVYIVATVSLARGGGTWRRVALVAISTELVGVLAVGLALGPGRDGLVRVRQRLRLRPPRTPVRRTLVAAPHRIASVTGR